MPLDLHNAWDEKVKDMIAMVRRSCSLVSVSVFVLLVLSLRPLQAAEPATAKLIEFKTAILAEDPFSPLNQVGAPKREFKRGEVVTLVISGEPKAGYHTYPITQRTEKQDPVGLSTLTFADSPGLQPLAPLRESTPVFVDTKIAGVWLEYEHSFAWSQDVLILPDAKPGRQVLRFTIRVQVCNDGGCKWSDHVLEAPVEVSDAPPVTLTAAVEQRLKEKPPPIKVVPVPAGMGSDSGSEASTASGAKIIYLPDSDANYKAGLDSVQKELKGIEAIKGEGNSGLLWFILTGVFWGGVSLVTPCVFPMIPITVSFFLKQSEKDHHRPITMALVYCGTIVVVLTIAAVALLSLFRELSVHPVMNIGLGALFVFFALSLFGMYEIELPAGLANYTSAREGKGGLVGTMFMALTFTIVSFACVAPFLGGFGGTAASGGFSFWHRVLGGLAFAVTFAAPFFVLAIFPNLLKKMPKSGSWLNSVKVVMGFLELAAALKFFRAGELVLVPRPVLFTYDLVMGMYVVLLLMCGLYLFGFYRLPHDTPSDHISVPRMLFGLGFLSLAFYLMPAQFKVNSDGEAQRPNGTIYAWIDSFLLPEPGEGKGELAWSGNLKGVLDTARAEAQRSGKPQRVFVDFTGETCTNCKINEKSVFIKPEIRSLFQKYQLVQMYTDKVPDKFYPPDIRSRFGSDTARQRADAAANLAFQRAAFGTEQLPLYVILEPQPNGTILVAAQYDEGKINNEAAFAQFLKTPINATGVALAK